MEESIRDRLQYDEVVMSVFASMVGPLSPSLCESISEVIGRIYPKFEERLLESCSREDIETFLTVNEEYTRLVETVAVAVAKIATGDLPEELDNV